MHFSICFDGQDAGYFNFRSTLIGTYLLIVVSIETEVCHMSILAQMSHNKALDSRSIVGGLIIHRLSY